MVRRVALVLALGVACVAVPASAQTETRERIREAAAGEEEVHPTERHSLGQHALTLHEREMVVGLWRIEYGIFDFLSVGTHTPYWIAGLPFGTTFANLYARVGFQIHDVFSMGMRVGFTYFDLGQVAVAASGDPDLQIQSKLVVVPIALLMSLHVDWFTASLETIFTAVGGDVAVDVDDDTGVGGFAYTSTLQMYLNLQFRLSEEFAFTGQLRYLPWHSPIVLGVAYSEMDGRTTVTGEIETTVSSLQHSAAALAGIFLTFGAFNLRFSLGYGRFFFPDVGLVVPIDFIQADLDVYFRFRFE